MAATQDSLFDPATYRLMCVPHESEEAADKAIRGFNDEVGELRKKYKLADVHIIIQGSCVTSDKDEMQFLSSFSFGDALKIEGMLAQTLGSEQKRKRELLGKLLAAANR